MEIDLIKERFDKVFELLHEIKEKVSKDPEPNYSSERTHELIAAFAAAQAEYPSIYVNKTDAYWKNEFADLDAIMSKIRPVLSKFGLVFFQFMEIGEMTILHSRLMHTSGQWIESQARIIPTKNDLQNYASAKIFMQRQAAMELLNITIKDNPFDDNAHLEMSQTRTVMEKGTEPTPYKPKEQSHSTITKEQLEELEYELADWKDIAEMVMDKLQLTSLADMPKSKYMSSLQKIREIKALRKSVQ